MDEIAIRRYSCANTDAQIVFLDQPGGFLVIECVGLFER